MNLRDTLQKHNFKFKKKFGQNFITDGNLLQKIVDAGDVGPDDVIIEVGPGAATLTKALAQRAKAVIAIEIDHDLIPIIEETMEGFDNFYLVQGDALELNLDETADLLRTAGLALSPSSRFDLIVGYCISHKIYNIIEINTYLFDYDEPLLVG